MWALAKRGKVLTSPCEAAALCQDEHVPDLTIPPSSAAWAWVGCILNARQAVFTTVVESSLLPLLGKMGEMSTPTTAPGGAQLSIGAPPIRLSDWLGAWRHV